MRQMIAIVMCHICAKEFFDSNFFDSNIRFAVVDKISNFHETAPNFIIITKTVILKVWLELFRPTANNPRNSKVTWRFSRLSSFRVTDQKRANIVLVNNSRTARPSEIIGLHSFLDLFFKTVLIINDSQLAKMKKYIPHMSLPWNL